MTSILRRIEVEIFDKFYWTDNHKRVRRFELKAGKKFIHELSNEIFNSYMAAANIKGFSINQIVLQDGSELNIVEDNNLDVIIRYTLTEIK